MRIKVLSPDVAMRIAAGEVVERPVSVVKELIENSLDAGSTRISVRAVQGGRVSLVVEDNGRGIEEDDLVLSVKSHATSKISSLDDLEAIGTLGYRGEALASIAAVGRLDIRSRTAERSSGGWIKAEGGEIRSQGEINCKPGTRVQVDDLFFNLPARRKFLKSPVAEMRRISRLIQEYSVAYPEVAFSLSGDDKTVYSTPGSQDRRSVLQGLWGEEPAIRSSQGQRGNYRVSLWWQEAPRTSRISLMAFVNGRRIDEPAIKSAISSGEANSSGNWAVWIETPPDEVDVNVHPAKTEVLFRHGGDLFSSVRDCVASLQEGERKPSYTPGFTSGSISGRFQQRPALEGTSLFSRVMPPPTVKDGREPALRVSQEPEPVDRDSEVETTDNSVLFLGQLKSGYLIFDDGGELVIMDPHAAHERLNFERIRVSMSSGEGSQRLAVPMALPPSLQSDCEEHLDKLGTLGFEFCRSDGVVSLSSVPNLLGCGTIPPLTLLRSSLTGLDGDRVCREAVWLRWATMACKASVKLTWRLSSQEAMALWREINADGMPSTCPHGRPAIVRMSAKAIAAKFERS
ncbi:MAG: DNA mismatch repair endonuclease MutL [Synergistales bacterium]|nr:DNA mismatch repair endonuclease MutL [Synergistales bacterium]